MREIKFRIWNEIKKKMLLWPSEDMQLYHFDCNRHIFEWVRLGEMRTADGLIPMQFTGLKDKNGKEIYEGDIVTVKWDNIFPRSIEWSDSHGTWYLKHPDKGYFLLYDHGSEIKIIGNIYENPELLKG